MKIYKTVIL